jgi:uncharacterized protein YodC (DUF2158 family)
MAEFKTGDQVVLKSGGPTMTVMEELPTGQIRCQWFSGKNLKHGNFKPESLNEPEAVKLPTMSTEAKQAILDAARDEEG